MEHAAAGEPLPRGRAAYLRVLLSEMVVLAIFERRGVPWPVRITGLSPGMRAARAWHALFLGLYGILETKEAVLTYLSPRE